ncbi:MAG: hypothetical protein PPHEINF_4308 [uncultured Paraburkholderia sp.]|nr:MAG: hypothetical protein PPHEINF_4308 [uncultured Paraburkholderia sp.]CAH2799296.1 MAG: hypothetical protein PPHEESC_4429 [uncultured Paraburkholderia sp.]CAH2934360.1 MAG: hypothetical protein PPHEMADMSA_4372 [uncultured Paraburkholderia sp.]
MPIAAHADGARRLRRAIIAQVWEAWMANDKTEGIKEELKGMVNKGIGSITGNKAKKAEGDNRKDLGDQRENAEKGKVDPGNPSNL